MGSIPSVGFGARGPKFLEHGLGVKGIRLVVLYMMLCQLKMNIHPSFVCGLLVEPEEEKSVLLLRHGQHWRCQPHQWRDQGNSCLPPHTDRHTGAVCLSRAHVVPHDLVGKTTCFAHRAMRHHMRP